MFVELIEHLRCPAEHEEALLVAAATHSEQRHIVSGVLGCPVCGSEYPIRHGVARFAGATPPRAEAPSVEVASVEVASVEVASVEVAMRIAAFLELTDARSFALLCGRWGAHATPLAELVDTPLFLVNPPEGADISRAAAAIEAGTALPLAAGAARAAALDPALTAAPETVLRALRGGARVMAPAALPLPAGLTERARDAREWVAEKNATPEPAPRLVPLRRR